MSAPVETPGQNLPFPTDEKKQHELRSIVSNFLLITYHCDAKPISIEKVQFDFFRYYNISRANLTKFLEADVLNRFDIRHLDQDQVTVFLRLPLLPNDANVVIELEKWRTELAYNLNIQICTFELSKVNGVVPRPTSLAGTMKTLKMKDVLEHDPKKRFEVFGVIPFLYVNRINLNAEEVNMALGSWKKNIIDFLGTQGSYKKLSELTTFCPRPRQLPPHHKILSMLRSDNVNRFHYVQEGGELQVKVVLEGSVPHSSLLCNEWRESILVFLSSQMGKYKSPCEIGVVVHRPAQLPITYKMLEVLKADPLRRFDFKGELRDLRVGLKASKNKRGSRMVTVEPRRDGPVIESTWRHYEADGDGEITSIVSAISDELSSVNEDYVDLQKEIEFKFESSDSASMPIKNPNNEVPYGPGGTDTPMGGGKADFGLHMAPWNAQLPAPPGLSMPGYHWGLNGDFFKPSPEASNDLLDMDPGKLPSVRFTDYTSGDTSHDVWAKTASMSSFYSQQMPARSFSPVRSRSPPRSANKWGTLKPSVSRSPLRLTKFSIDPVKASPSRSPSLTTKLTSDPTSPAVKALSTFTGAHVELKRWLPTVLNGFDSALVLTFIDQMRDEYGFLTTEDLYNAQIENQLTLDVLKDINGFKIGHFNRIVKGLAALTTYV